MSASQQQARCTRKAAATAASGGTIRRAVICENSTSKRSSRNSSRGGGCQGTITRSKNRQLGKPESLEKTTESHSYSSSRGNSADAVATSSCSPGSSGSTFHSGRATATQQQQHGDSVVLPGLQVVATQNKSTTEFVYAAAESCATGAAMPLETSVASAPGAASLSAAAASLCTKGIGTHTLFTTTVSTSLPALPSEGHAATAAGVHTPSSSTSACSSSSPTSYSSGIAPSSMAATGLHRTAYSTPAVAEEREITHKDKNRKGESVTTTPLLLLPQAPMRCCSNSSIRDGAPTENNRTDLVSIPFPSVASYCSGCSLSCCSTTCTATPDGSPAAVAAAGRKQQQEHDEGAASSSTVPAALASVKELGVDSSTRDSPFQLLLQQEQVEKVEQQSQQQQQIPQREGEAETRVSDASASVAKDVKVVNSRRGRKKDPISARAAGERPATGKSPAAILKKEEAATTIGTALHREGVHNEAATVAAGGEQINQGQQQELKHSLIARSGNAESSSSGLTATAGGEDEGENLRTDEELCAALHELFDTPLESSLPFATVSADQKDDPAMDSYSAAVKAAVAALLGRAPGDDIGMSHATEGEHWRQQQQQGTTSKMEQQRKKQPRLHAVSRSEEVCRDGAEGGCVEKAAAAAAPEDRRKKHVALSEKASATGGTTQKKQSVSADTPSTAREPTAYSVSCENITSTISGPGVAASSAPATQDNALQQKQQQKNSDANTPLAEGHPYSSLIKTSGTANSGEEETIAEGEHQQQRKSLFDAEADSLCVPSREGATATFDCLPQQLLAAEHEHQELFAAAAVAAAAAAPCTGHNSSRDLLHPSNTLTGIMSCSANSSSSKTVIPQSNPTPVNRRCTSNHSTSGSIDSKAAALHVGALGLSRAVKEVAAERTRISLELHQQQKQQQQRHPHLGRSTAPQLPAVAVAFRQAAAAGQAVSIGNNRPSYHAEKQEWRTRYYQDGRRCMRTYSAKYYGFERAKRLAECFNHYVQTRGTLPTQEELLLLAAEEPGALCLRGNNNSSRMPSSGKQRTAGGSGDFSNSCARHRKLAPAPAAASHLIAGVSSPLPRSLSLLSTGCFPDSCAPSSNTDMPQLAITANKRLQQQQQQLVAALCRSSNTVFGVEQQLQLAAAVSEQEGRKSGDIRCSSSSSSDIDSGGEKTERKTSRNIGGNEHGNSDNSNHSSNNSNHSSNNSSNNSNNSISNDSKSSSAYNADGATLAALVGRYYQQRDGSSNSYNTAAEFFSEGFTPAATASPCLAHGQDQVQQQHHQEAANREAAKPVTSTRPGMDSSGYWIPMLPQPLTPAFSAQEAMPVAPSDKSECKYWGENCTQSSIQLLLQLLLLQQKRSDISNDGVGLYHTDKTETAATTCSQFTGVAEEKKHLSQLNLASPSYLWPLQQQQQRQATLQQGKQQQEAVQQRETQHQRGRGVGVGETDAVAAALRVSAASNVCDSWDRNTSKAVSTRSGNFDTAAAAAAGDMLTIQGQQQRERHSQYVNGNQNKAAVAAAGAFAATAAAAVAAAAAGGGGDSAISCEQLQQLLPLLQQQLCTLRQHYGWSLRDIQESWIRTASLAAAASTIPPGTQQQQEQGAEVYISATPAAGEKGDTVSAVGKAEAEDVYGQSSRPLSRRKTRDSHTEGRNTTSSSSGASVHIAAAAERLGRSGSVNSAAEQKEQSHQQQQQQKEKDITFQSRCVLQKTDVTSDSNRSSSSTEEKEDVHSGSKLNNNSADADRSDANSSSTRDSSNKESSSKESSNNDADSSSKASGRSSGSNSIVEGEVGLGEGEKEQQEHRTTADALQQFLDAYAADLREVPELMAAITDSCCPCTRGSMQPKMLSQQHEQQHSQHLGQKKQPQREREETETEHLKEAEGATLLFKQRQAETCELITQHTGTVCTGAARRLYGREAAVQQQHHESAAGAVAVDAGADIQEEKQEAAKRAAGVTATADESEDDKATTEGFVHFFGESEQLLGVSRGCLNSASVYICGLVHALEDLRELLCWRERRKNLERRKEGRIRQAEVDSEEGKRVEVKEEVRGEEEKRSLRRREGGQETAAATAEGLQQTSENTGKEAIQEKKQKEKQGKKERMKDADREEFIASKTETSLFPRKNLSSNANEPEKTRGFLLRKGDMKEPHQQQCVATAPEETLLSQSASEKTEIGTERAQQKQAEKNAYVLSEGATADMDVSSSKDIVSSCGNIRTTRSRVYAHATSSDGSSADSESKKSRCGVRGTLDEATAAEGEPLADKSPGDEAVEEEAAGDRGAEDRAAAAEGIARQSEAAEDRAAKEKAAEDWATEGRAADDGVGKGRSAGKETAAAAVFVKTEERSYRAKYHRTEEHHAQDLLLPLSAVGADRWTYISPHALNRKKKHHIEEHQPQYHRRSIHKSSKSTSRSKSSRSRSNSVSTTLKQSSESERSRSFSSDSCSSCNTGKEYMSHSPYLYCEGFKQYRRCRKKRNRRHSSVIHSNASMYLARLDVHTKSLERLAKASSWSLLAAFSSLIKKDELLPSEVDVIQKTQYGQESSQPRRQQEKEKKKRRLQRQPGENQEPQALQHGLMQQEQHCQRQAAQQQYTQPRHQQQWKRQGALCKEQQEHQQLQETVSGRLKGYQSTLRADGAIVAEQLFGESCLDTSPGSCRKCRRISGSEMLSSDMSPGEEAENDKGDWENSSSRELQLLQQLRRAASEDGETETICTLLKALELQTAAGASMLLSRAALQQRIFDERTKRNTNQSDSASLLQRTSIHTKNNHPLSLHRHAKAAGESTFDSYDVPMVAVKEEENTYRSAAIPAIAAAAAMETHPTTRQASYNESAAVIGADDACTICKGDALSAPLISTCASQTSTAAASSFSREALAEEENEQTLDVSRAEEDFHKLHREEEKNAVLLSNRDKELSGSSNSEMSGRVLIIGSFERFPDGGGSTLAEKEKQKEFEGGKDKKKRREEAGEKGKEVENEEEVVRGKTGGRVLSGSITRGQGNAARRATTVDLSKSPAQTEILQARERTQEEEGRQQQQTRERGKEKDQKEELLSMVLPERETVDTGDIPLKDIGETPQEGGETQQQQEQQQQVSVDQSIQQGSQRKTVTRGRFGADEEKSRWVQIYEEQLTQSRAAAARLGAVSACAGQLFRRNIRLLLEVVSTVKRDVFEGKERTRRKIVRTVIKDTGEPAALAQPTSGNIPYSAVTVPTALTVQRAERRASSTETVRGAVSLGHGSKKTRISAEEQQKEDESVDSKFVPTRQSGRDRIQCTRAGEINSYNNRVQPCCSNELRTSDRSEEESGVPRSTQASTLHVSPFKSSDAAISSDEPTGVFVKKRKQTTKSATHSKGRSSSIDASSGRVGGNVAGLLSPASSAATESTAISCGGAGTSQKSAAALTEESDKSCDEGIGEEKDTGSLGKKRRKSSKCLHLGGEKESLSDNDVVSRHTEKDEINEFDVEEDSKEESDLHVINLQCVIETLKQRCSLVDSVARQSLSCFSDYQRTVSQYLQHIRRLQNRNGGEKIAAVWSRTADSINASQSLYNIKSHKAKCSTSFIPRARKSKAESSMPLVDTHFGQQQSGNDHSPIDSVKEHPQLITSSVRRKAWNAVTSSEEEKSMCDIHTSATSPSESIQRFSGVSDMGDVVGNAICWGGGGQGGCGAANTQVNVTKGKSYGNQDRVLPHQLEECGQLQAQEVPIEGMTRSPGDCFQLQQHGKKDHNMSEQKVKMAGFGPVGVTDRFGEASFRDGNQEKPATGLQVIGKRMCEDLHELTFDKTKGKHTLSLVLQSLSHCNREDTTEVAAERGGDNVSAKDSSKGQSFITESADICDGEFETVEPIRGADGNDRLQGLLRSLLEMSDKPPNGKGIEGEQSAKTQGHPGSEHSVN